MYLLPKWIITNKRPSIHDTESLTILEGMGKVYGAMNDLINEYNSFADNVNTIITEFTNSATKNQEEFEVALRQEFQDFIDVIEIKTQQQQTQIDNAVSYMRDNIVSTTKKIISDGIANGTIGVVNILYDDGSESLNIVQEGAE